MHTQLLTAVGPVTEQTARAVRDLVGHCVRSTGIAPISEQPLLRLQNPQHLAAHVLAIYDNCLVGYMNIDLSGSLDVVAEFVVRPDFPDAELVDRLLHAGHYVADQHNRNYSVWLHNPAPETVALFVHNGFATQRSLSRMFLNLKALPSPSAISTDAGSPTESSESTVTIRTFTVGEDEEKWVTANAQAFAWHPEQGKLTLDDLHDRMKEQWFDEQNFFVIDHPTQPDQLAGFAWVKAEPLAPNAEIYALATLPSIRGKGAGRKLLTHALNTLKDKGYKESDLYVESDNEAAIALYASIGYAETERHIKLTKQRAAQPK